MDIAKRSVLPIPLRPVAAFLAIWLALYMAAAGIAELTVGRQGQETAFQKLYALQGQKVDWVVLGASHALPLDYGDVPDRLLADTGQSMAVLATVGAGPLYSDFVFRQALDDLAPSHLLYIVDSFGFSDAQWNEARIIDRDLLRQTPLRLTTARHLASVTAEHAISPTGLADYLSAFSKLNPPDRFPQGGWRGAADFDRKVRLSRFAVQSRIEYLYPSAPRPTEAARYLAVLEALLDRAERAGVDVTVVKLPLPDAFRAALPDEDAFDQALRARLAPRGIPYHDLSGALTDPANFFDPDHMNRVGVEALYTGYLRDLLAPANDR